MPIVVSRATGEIISKPELTQADRGCGLAAVGHSFPSQPPVHIS